MLNILSDSQSFIGLGIIFDDISNSVKLVYIDDSDQWQGIDRKVSNLKHLAFSTVKGIPFQFSSDQEAIIELFENQLTLSLRIGSSTYHIFNSIEIANFSNSVPISNRYFGIVVENLNKNLTKKPNFAISQMETYILSDSPDIVEDQQGDLSQSSNFYSIGNSTKHNRNCGNTFHSMSYFFSLLFHIMLFINLYFCCS